MARFDRNSSAVVLAFFGSFFLNGCVLTESWITKAAPPVEPKVMQIAVTWDNQVKALPDPVNQGRPNPCLAGRLYLFGSEGSAPIKTEGSIVVQMFVDGPPESGGAPRLIEQWNISPNLAKQLERKDMIGYGYTLLLPCGTYHPELTSVTMSVCFTGKDGVPHYARSRLRLQHEQREFHISQRMEMGSPAGAAPARPTPQSHPGTTLPPAGAPVPLPVPPISHQPQAPPSLQTPPPIGTSVPQAHPTPAANTAAPHAHSTTGTAARPGAPSLIVPTDARTGNLRQFPITTSQQTILVNPQTKEVIR